MASHKEHPSTSTSQSFTDPASNVQEVDAKAREHDTAHQQAVDPSTSDELEPTNQANRDNSQDNKTKLFSVEDFEMYLANVQRQYEGEPELISIAEGLMEQGRSLCRLFGQTDIVDYINMAIYIQSRAASLAPSTYQYKPGMLSTLGFSYRTRSDYLKNLEDIEKAIEYTTQAAKLAPEGYEGNPDRAGIFVNLGVCYHQRFQILYKLADLDTAIIHQTHALSLVPEGHATRSGVLSNLGVMSLTRFERLGELADVSKSIDYLHQALAQELDDPVQRLPVLVNLANSYEQRFASQGELVDLDQAVNFQNQVVEIIPNAHPRKGDMLSSLGNLYQTRFLRLGRLADANEAINCRTRAVTIAPDEHTDKPELLNDLGCSYRSRFQQFGELPDVDQAIAYMTQAVELVPEGYRKKPRMLVDLGIAYQCRFERLGDLADVDKAIDYASQAAALYPEGHDLTPGILNTLGNSYQSRFERLGELADVDRAVNFKSQAVSLATESDPKRPLMLANLGISYEYRFKHSRELTDINKAIEYLNQANLFLTDTHLNKARLLISLGDAYKSRFDHYRKLEDINQALSWHRKAFTLLRDGHTDRLMALSKLSTSYYGRYDLLGDLADLESALDLTNRAVVLTPDGHSEKPGMLDNLGWYFRRRFQRQGNPEDIDAALLSFQQAAISDTGPPLVRLSASRRWAKLSFSNSVSSPLLAYQTTMELVPQIAWVGTTIDQRYRLISDMGDLAVEAASCAIALGAYDLALEWLEAGRSIVWNQILQLRTPFDELSAANPTLANRLQEVSRELEHAGSRSSTTSTSFSENVTISDLQQDAQRHHRLASEWDELLQKARDIPGFHDFMRSRRAKELTRAAMDGPVAIINVHSSRCDALVIRPNCEEIAHVPLERFSFGKATSARVDLTSLLERRGGRAGGFKRTKPSPQAEDLFKRTLSTLWLDVVEPIFDFLGYTGKLPTDELPHITWCTTGPLSFLPLHAAGCYDESQPKAFDLVVSSYTPTLGALLVPKSPKSHPHTGILAVGQEHTQGFADLPNTVPELAAIREHAQTTRYLQLDGRNATVDAVVSAMRQYNWVHLACHATQMTGDPSQSAFHLCGDNLTLAAITKQSFKEKGLAFLSACQTATGDEKLPDEAVHLAAGMLMAGYRSVIGTMWSIHDEDAPEVTRQVYADLLKDGRMDYTEASRALHRAVTGLRRKVGEDSFERWAPFVHIGS